jgi:hypothetical protein
VRTLARVTSACAILALLLACVAGDSQGSLSGDDGNDDVSSFVDLSRILPATRTEPVLALAPSGSVFVDQQSPNARLTTLEIFRPPRARA